MRPRPLFAVLLAAAFALLASLCACWDSAVFSTRFTPEFAHGQHAVSVFGIFKDGQMSSDAWESLGAALSAPFGAKCDTAYAALVASNQKASAAIDDYVRANGPGDDLLAQLAPAATGDLILVFTIAGKVVPLAPNAPSTATAPPGSPMSTGSKSRAMPANGSYRPARGMQHARIGGGTFEISASLYSVRERRSVGLVTMQYDGPTVDDAIRRMVEKLRANVPGSTCGGWDWKAEVDDKRIRELIDQ